VDKDSDQKNTDHRLVCFAAERTLMAWVRTALSLMALGFVIDRFGLVLRQMLPVAGPQLHPHAFSFWAGTVVVLLGTVMALVSVVRYLSLALAYRREGNNPIDSGILLGVLFAAIVSVLGIVIAVFLIVATD